MFTFLLRHSSRFLAIAAHIYPHEVAAGQSWALSRETRQGARLLGRGACRRLQRGRMSPCIASAAFGSSAICANCLQLGQRAGRCHALCERLSLQMNINVTVHPRTQRVADTQCWTWAGKLGRGAHCQLRVAMMRRCLASATPAMSRSTLGLMLHALYACYAL